LIGSGDSSNRGAQKKGSLGRLGKEGGGGWISRRKRTKKRSPLTEEIDLLFRHSLDLLSDGGQGIFGRNEGEGKESGQKGESSDEGEAFFDLDRGGGRVRGPKEKSGLKKRKGCRLMDCPLTRGMGGIKWRKGRKRAVAPQCRGGGGKKVGH